MITYGKLIENAKKKIDLNSLEHRAIYLFLGEILNADKTKILMLKDELVEDNILEKFSEMLADYIVDEIPIEYILGYTYFYGYKMIVNGDVLIPRPETEELIGYVLAYYDEMFDGKKVDLVDVGTGSGNIAIALACEEKNMTVTATDISFEALETAKQNAINNSANVTFLQGNMLDPLIEKGMKFDILVSNPPYIPDSEYVEPLVLDNEPNIALFGGDNGMKFYIKKY